MAETTMTGPHPAMKETETETITQQGTVLPGLQKTMITENPEITKPRLQRPNHRLQRGWNWILSLLCMSRSLQTHGDPSSLQSLSRGVQNPARSQNSVSGDLPWQQQRRGSGQTRSQTWNLSTKQPSHGNQNHLV